MLFEFIPRIFLGLKFARTSTFLELVLRNVIDKAAAYGAGFLLAHIDLLKVQ